MSSRALVPSSSCRPCRCGWGLVRSQLTGAKGKGGNAAAAKIVGARLAQKARAAGIESVAFDRAGYRYHGRVKALAEAAREAGLKF